MKHDLLLMTIFSTRSGMSVEVGHLSEPRVFLSNVEHMIDSFYCLCNCSFAIRCDYYDTMDVLFKVFVPVHNIIAQICNICEHALLVDIIANIIGDAQLHIC